MTTHTAPTSADRAREITEARDVWVTARVDRYFDEHESGYATDDQIRRWTAKATEEWYRRHPALVKLLDDANLPKQAADLPWPLW